MKKKLITLFLIVASVFMMYGNYLLISKYYDSGYYDVELTAEIDDIVFSADSGSQTMNINIKNNSRRILSSQNNIYLSYHLLSDDGEMLQFDYPRTNLTTINPYNSDTISVTVERPEQPGKYQIEIDLVEEGVCWFKDKGSKTLLIRIA